MHYKFYNNQDLKNERINKLNSFTYENADLKPEEHCVMEIIVTDPIANDNDNLATYSFAFEMETIYGYTYTQYIVITIRFEPQDISNNDIKNFRHNNIVKKGIW